MAESNKTEQATPKKRRDERKKGNVFLSKDANAVASLLAGFFVLKLIAPMMTRNLYGFYEYCMYYAKTLGVGQVQLVFSELAVTGMITFLKTCGLLMATSIVIAIIVTFAQTKMLVSPESMKPKFNRINPLQGFKKLFSMRGIVEALKGLIKISILLYIMFRFLKGMVNDFFQYVNLDITQACNHLFQSTFSMVLQILIAFVAVAALDFLYQWWDYEQKLKMTKQEVKDEYKQIEGDPKIKAKIKENQRKLAQSRMMQQVPEADVVIRNPEHVAIALRYKLNEDVAPVVLAKGLDSLALRIVAVAEEHNIPTVENVPLARALYGSVEIGQAIPAEFYTAVADVLVYLYRIGKKQLPPS